jgi:protease PrsW
MTTAGTIQARRDSIRAVRATAVALCLFGLGTLSWQFYRYLVVFPKPTVLAAVLELPLLGVGFLILMLVRPVRSPDFTWAGASLVWGATAAAGCALLANQGLGALWAKEAGVGFAANWSAALSAPLNEEIFKLCGVVLIVLAAPGVISGPLDGLIYGAFTGLGFQVIENITYGLNNIELTGATNPGRAVLESAVVRIGATGLGSHWTMTAVAGAGIGYLVARGRSRDGVLPAAACLLAAIGMHLLFDAPHISLGLKVGVNFIAVGTLFLWLSSRYLATARSVLDASCAAGLITPDQAVRYLSRRGRRAELRAAGSAADRHQARARQQAILARIDAAPAWPPGGPAGR